MTETQTQRFNPETGKPNPLSTREYMTMTFAEQKQFIGPLSRQEKKDFQLAFTQEYLTMSLAQRREIQKAALARLEARENKTIGQKLELLQAKMHMRHLMLPEKQPIFFRKLRSREISLPKWLQRKSPYLISASL
jgi:hypothetical protein